MDRRKIVNDFVNFVCNQNNELINDFALMHEALEYEKSFTSDSDET